MILSYGDVTKLRGRDWFMVELRSEKTGESTIKRVGKAIPGIFRNDPIEIFVPIGRRDLDLFELKTACYVFVRSTNFSSILRLRTITGVVCVLTEGESNRPSKALKLADSYVQELIAAAEKEFNDRAVTIQQGSFVRILDGQPRDYCGYVESLNDGIACVRIDLKTKSLLIESPVRNLLDLPHIPTEQRVFYYCPVVEELVHDMGESGKALIAEDLMFTIEEPATQEDIPPVEITPEPEAAKRHSRQKTVTALVKKLIFDNVVDPMSIAQHVVNAIKAGSVKPPKNLFIVYCIVKNHLMRFHFRNTDPELKSYRDVIRKYGRQYKFSARDISKLDPNVTVPIRTAEVCQDGRSRQARMLKKMTNERALPLTVCLSGNQLSVSEKKTRSVESLLQSAPWLNFKLEE